MRDCRNWQNDRPAASI